jgi:hypothetical protein
MKLLRVEWEDLLRVPFLEGGDDPAIGLDCWGQAREIARRKGTPFPAERPDPREPGEFERVVRWEEVGDLLTSDPTARGFVSHVSTVVDVARGLALSTSVRAGAFCWPIHRVHHEMGVYRLRLSVATG